MLDDDALIGLSAFLAAVSLAQFLARRDLRASGQRGGWVAASGLVLAAAGGLYLWHPPDAGLAALGVMLALLFVPNLAARAAESGLRGGRYRSAYVACLLVALLHPARSWWRTLRLITALLPTLRDDAPAAVAALRRLLADKSWSGTPERLLVRLHLARLTADWPALAALPPGPATDAARLRGLAELGDLPAMLDQYARVPPGSALLSLTVLAFCGRVVPVAQLLAGPLADLPRDAARLWLATARLAGGERARAIPVLEDLAAHAGRADLRAAAAWRLDRDRAGWSASPDALDPRHAAIVGQAAALADAAPVAGGATSIVTPALIALNLAMFALETWRGGSTESDVLYDLGALWPQDVIAGQSWRLASALFLHAGVPHILFNLLALAVFGAPLERRLGWWRFAALYVGAGLASMLAVTVLTVLGVLAPDLLVGASGAIMGLIGGMAALLLRQPGAEPRRARAGLRHMVLLIVLQSGIDLAVPHISMAGHLSGAASGFLIGLVLPLPGADRRLKRVLAMD